MEKITKESIVRVQFLNPVAEYGGQTDFYFGSLAAIYEMFTKEQIGCQLETLWSAKIDALHPKTTPKCVVSKQVLYRKKQKKEL
jgi:hypothetical protein